MGSKVINTCVTSLDTEMISTQMGKDGVEVLPGVAKRFSADEKQKPKGHILAQQPYGLRPDALRAPREFRKALAETTSSAPPRWKKVFSLLCE